MRGQEVQTRRIPSHQVGPPMTPQTLLQKERDGIGGWPPQRPTLGNRTGELSYAEKRYTSFPRHDEPRLQPRPPAGGRLVRADERRSMRSLTRRDPRAEPGAAKTRRPHGRCSSTQAAASVSLYRNSLSPKEKKGTFHACSARRLRLPKLTCAAVLYRACYEHAEAREEIAGADS